MQIHHAAPDFELPDLNGEMHRLHDYRNRIVILNFWSAECPQVARTDALLLETLGRWREEVVLLPIASNANESLELLKSISLSRGIPIVLIDANQQVADTYQAQVTPEVFVIDRQGILRYHGAMDDFSLRKRNPGHIYPAEAIDNLLAGSLPSVEEVPVFGCSIVRAA
jgi:peroxiredoxin